MRGNVDGSATDHLLSEVNAERPMPSVAPLKTDPVSVQVESTLTLRDLEEWIAADVEAVKSAVSELLAELLHTARRVGYSLHETDTDPCITAVRRMQQKLDAAQKNATEPLLSLNEIWRESMLVYLQKAKVAESSRPASLHDTIVRAVVMMEHVPRSSLLRLALRAIVHAEADEKMCSDWLAGDTKELQTWAQQYVPYYLFWVNGASICEAAAIMATLRETPYTDKEKP